MSETYVVEITGDAAAEIAEAAKMFGMSSGAVVSDALAPRRWIIKNARARKLFLRDGHKFREVYPGQ